MNRSLISFFAIAISTGLMAGCQREPAPPTAPASTPANPTADATPSAVDTKVDDKPDAYEAFVPNGPALDQRAFAGRFTGTLPCATCPGIDTQIEIKDDYTFQLTETYKESKDASPIKTKGTWSAESDGHMLRLDPDSKSEDDRLYQVLANDEIKLLDKEGKPIVGSLDYSLRRSN